jgi:hypothetical protein
VNTSNLTDSYPNLTVFVLKATVGVGNSYEYEQWMTVKFMIQSVLQCIFLSKNISANIIIV